MKVKYWVKFSNYNKPELFVAEHFTQFWHDLREFMLRNDTGTLEWLNKDY